MSFLATRRAMALSAAIFTTVTLAASCGGTRTALHRNNSPHVESVTPLAAPIPPTGPAPTYAYVTIPDTDQIVPVNLETQVPATALPAASSHPDPIAASPDGKFVLVGSFPPHRGGHHDSITVIDALNRRVLAPLSPPGDHPSSIAFTPKGRTAWVTMWSTGTVVPIDMTTMKVGQPIVVGGNPTGIEITHDGKWALVADFGSDVGWTKGRIGRTVRLVNLVSHKVGAPITVGPRPCDFAVNSTDTRAYVTVSGSNVVVPINLQSLEVLPAIRVGTAPEGIQLSPDGSTLYVTEKGSPIMSPNLGSGSLVSVDLKTRTVRTIVKPLDDPWDVALTPDGHTAYVTNTDKSSVEVVDLVTGSSHEIALPSRSHAVVFALG